MRTVMVSGLSKQYGKHAVLAGLSFHLNEGESLAVVGPNGVGKTTLLNLISGALRPSSGEVLLFGHPVSSLKHLGHLIGVVHQESYLPEQLTVDEYLSTEASLRQVAPQDVRVQVERAALTEVMGQSLGQLSKGMQRRVILARAMLHAPRLLLLDEPTVGLDPLSREEIWRYLEACKEEGLTCLVSTHYMDEIQAICDKALFLSHRENQSDYRLLELRATGACAKRLTLRYMPTSVEVANDALRSLAVVDDGAFEVISVGTNSARLQLPQNTCALNSDLLSRLPTERLKITGILMEHNLLETIWHEYYVQPTDRRAILAETT